MTAPAFAPAPLRPRSGPELIDAAFVVLRRHYTELVAAMAVFLVPSALLGLILPAEMQFVKLIVEALLFLPATGAVISLASDAYLGREVSVSDAVRHGASRWLSIWGAGIIQWLFISLGFLLLIVPAFIFYAWTFAMPIVVMLEGAGAGDSFTRSRQLARGDVLRILGVVGLTTLIVYILVFAIAFMLAALAGGIGESGESRVADAASSVVSIFVFPVLYVVSTLLYYDLRIRKEGFDLEMMASSLDPARAGGASGANRS